MATTDLYLSADQEISYQYALKYESNSGYFPNKSQREDLQRTILPPKNAYDIMSQVAINLMYYVMFVHMGVSYILLQLCHGNQVTISNHH